MDKLVRKHNYKLKLIRSMKKVLSISMMVVIALTLIALCSPCILIFSMEGEDGNLTLPQWLGIIWLGVLVICGLKMKKRDSGKPD